MNCFILCRQSVGQTDPDESLSIEVQEAECREFAKSKNLNVIDVFLEANSSGRLYPLGFEQIAASDWIYTKWCEETKKTGSFREELGKMLKRLDEVEYIVCYDSTRLFRPLNGSYMGNVVSQALMAHGVKLLTIKEGIIDFSRFQDSLISSLTSQINSEQLNIQREKVKAALKRMKNEGEYHSGIARTRGYEPTGRKHEVIINKEEAEMVKEIFKLYNSGWTLSDVTQHINEKYAHLFIKPCHRQIFRRIILNPAYCGYMLNSDGELIKCKPLQGKEIITLDEWMTAQRKIDVNRVYKSRPKSRWLPLSPLLFCGVCGSKISVHGGQEGSHPFYGCFRHLRDGGKPCQINLTVSNDVQEGIGINEAIKPLLLAEALHLMKAAKNESAERAKLAEVELALNEIAKKSKKLTEMWMNSLMNEDVYESAIKDLKQRENELSRKQRALELELNQDTSQFDWAKLMMKFRGDALTNGEYEALTNRMIKKILVYQDHLEVKTIYGDVEIPRQHVGRYRLVCNYALEMKNGKAAVYFYKGKAIHHSKDVLYSRTAILNEVDIFIEE